MLYVMSIVAAVLGSIYIAWYPMFARKHNKGVWTRSYSATYDLFMRVGKPWHWGIYACTVSGLVMLGAWHHSPEWYLQVLMVAGAFYLMAVGCFPSRVNKTQTQIHKWMAKLCAFTWGAWLLLQGPLAWLAVPIPLLIYFLLYKKWPHATDLWIEWAGFQAAFLAITILAVNALV